MEEVFILGNGGREKAIQQAVQQSQEVDPERVIVSADLRAGLEQFSGPKLPFVIIGPEAPLAWGVANKLRSDGYTVFGMGAAAAAYEADKRKSARLAHKYSIAQPDFFIPKSLGEAKDYVARRQATDFVIKAAGFAQGKGVFLPDDTSEALDTTKGLWDGKLAGNAGNHSVIFYDRYHGPEVSPIAIVGAGENDFLTLPLCQDRKRVGDGDTGLNTGGMAAYSPLPKNIIGEKQLDDINDIIYRSLYALNRERANCKGGAIYPGLMLAEETAGNPVLLEYNMRFGDPETQIQMAILSYLGVDVYRLLKSAAEGQIERLDIDLERLAVSALTICLASEGYPGKSVVGKEIWGLENEYDGVSIQEAAVEYRDGRPFTTGGRAIWITATGKDINDARNKAYQAIDQERQGPESSKVGFSGMHFRSDVPYPSTNN